MKFRIAIFGVLLAVFSLFVALRVSGFIDAYDTILNGWGVVVGFPTYLPYLDTHVVLAAIQCHREGYDVFEYNPCDIMGRWHIYSPVWLFASPTGVGIGDTPWVGTAMAVAFLAAAAWVTNATTAGEAAIFLLALLSQSFALAVDRGNFDLLMFIAVVAACAVFARGPAWRPLSYAAIFICAILKFYPIVAFGVALTERPRRFLVVSALAAIGWGLFFYFAWSDLTRLWPHIPHAQPLQDAFGGFNFFQALGHLVVRYVPAEATLINAAAPRFYQAACVAALALSLFFARRLRGGGLTLPVAGGVGTFFLVGTLISLFAFFTAQNPPYRAIWLLLPLPLLIRMRRDRAAPRWLWNGEIVLLIVALWFESFHNWAWRLTGSQAVADLLAFLVREPLWWAFVIGLMTLLWVQTASMPIVAQLIARGRRAAQAGAA
jgi:hypothetical protein